MCPKKIASGAFDFTRLRDTQPTNPPLDCTQSLFDKRGTKTIPNSSVGELLRALGQNPTQAEVAEIQSGLPADVDLDTFISVLNRPDGYRSAGTAGARRILLMLLGETCVLNFLSADEFIRGFQ